MSLPIIPTFRYTKEDIESLAKIVRGEVLEKDITIVQKAMLKSLDDSNGSSIREMVTCVALGFPPRLSNEKYENDSFDHNGLPMNAKPKTVSLELIESPFIEGKSIAPIEKSKLLCGNSNYNDLTLDLLSNLVEKDLQFLMAGYCGNNLLYGLKFPILAIAEVLLYKTINHASRSKSWNFTCYKGRKSVELLFLREDIGIYSPVLDLDFFQYVKQFTIGIKELPKKKDILDAIIAAKSGTKIQISHDHDYFGV